MFVEWGLAKLARRIYSDKDNSVCLSRCACSASCIKQLAFDITFTVLYKCSEKCLQGFRNKILP